MFGLACLVVCRLDVLDPAWALRIVGDLKGPLPVVFYFVAVCVAEPVSSSVAAVLAMPGGSSSFREWDCLRRLPCGPLLAAGVLALFSLWAWLHSHEGSGHLQLGYGLNPRRQLQHLGC